METQISNISFHLQKGRLIHMAKAKKLPSGSWRCLVYSHTEKVWNQKKQEWVDKRIYESFTSDDPTAKGKREAEYAAAEFARDKERRKDVVNCTLGELVDKYIESKDSVLSATTIEDYKKKRKNGFKQLMDMPIKSLSQEVLQSAVNQEAKRKSKKKPTETISPKTVRNEYGLITAALNSYTKIDCTVTLPKVPVKIKELNTPDAIFAIFEGTEIELPVLLAMWLSFSMSEIRGLTKSKSISPDGNYITIQRVITKAGNKDVEKEMGKTGTRLRRHRIPPYIKSLIDKVPGDVLVPMTYNKLYHKFQGYLEASDMPHMTFHDLRHVNASVMAQLNIPDKYAQERGGWKTDRVMKRVYTHTFSEQRKIVDNTIDDYFEKIMQHEMQHK